MFEETTPFVQDFLEFVAVCHELMGQTELYQRQGIDLGRVELALSDPDELTSELITENWNQLAGRWAVMESPVNYGLTMATLLQFVKTNDRLRTNGKETILSLGTGPGLYELYLAQMCERVPGFQKIRIVCLDAAREMRAYQEQLTDKLRARTGLRFRNIRTVTADMTHLPLADRSVSQVIVNNSLGWVPEWQQALREIARVILPDRLGHAYFFVHPHPMSVRDQEGNSLYTLNTMVATDLMDELERLGCTINNTRLMAAQGTGQAGRNTQRIFIKGRFTHEEPGSWRERAAHNQVTTHLTPISLR